MPDRKPPIDPDALEFDELEPLAEPSETEELEPLEPLEPEPAPAAAAAPAAAPAATGGSAGGTVSRGFQLRELDKAPKHLRLAAAIVVVGSLVPWLGHGGGLMTNVVAKAVMILGVAINLLYWKYRAGGDVAAPFAKLSEIHLVPKKKEDETKKRRSRRVAPQSATASVLRGAKFPAAIHVLVVAVLAVGLYLPQLDPGVSETNTYLRAAGELGMLAWGVAAWVHIYAYERWAPFNPIFPLVFLGPAVTGVSRAIQGFGEAGTPWQIAGGALVGAGGVFAAWTIIEALRQAKAEGDAKKAAAAEARRAARRSRSSDGAGESTRS